jgi:gamma-glutamyltranspeptidase
VLQYCGSGADKFYLITTASQTVTAFNALGTSPSKLRVARSFPQLRKQEKARPQRPGFLIFENSRRAYSAKKMRSEYARAA